MYKKNYGNAVCRSEYENWCSKGGVRRLLQGKAKRLEKPLPNAEAFAVKFNSLAFRKPFAYLLCFVHNDQSRISLF